MDVGGYAFVIGGGSGICRATSLVFAKDGARGLLVADIDLDAARKTAEDSKAVATNPEFSARATRVDVTDPESVQGVTAEMVEAFGRIDYCVNGAGISGSTFSDVAEMDFAEFQKVLGVNLNGSFHVLQAVSNAMIAQEPRANDAALPGRGFTRGSIVNLGSIASFRSMYRSVNYTTSKHALLGLTKNAALDNIKHGIRVNLVCPSWIDTPMVGQFSRNSPAFEEQIIAQIPMGRLGTPEEIADAIIFLSSPRASWINGCSLMVDGAMSIRL